MAEKQFPSTTRTYDTIAELEGHALRDDLIALAELHNLDRWTNGFTNAQVALYLSRALDALRMVGPPLGTALSSIRKDDDT